MRGKCQFWLHLILILSLTISTALMSPVTASPTTTLYVDPASIIDTGLTPGKSFTININVAGVTDLFGFNFKLKYKTAVLTATSVAIGSFLLPDYIEWQNEINDAVGYVWYSVSQDLYEEAGVTGSGTLATISFTVDALGGSCLYLCDTQLTATPDTEEHPIDHEVYDGHFVNAPVHDIAITRVTPSNTLVIQGQTVNVTVVARNHGNFTESFNVAAYANATAIGTPKTVTNLAPGGREKLNFTWDTTGVTLGNYTIYTISANATTVPEETDTTDNTYNRNYNYYKKTYVYIIIKVIEKGPVAAFNYSPTCPVVNETVTFNASDSTPSSTGNITFYHWKFGDGTPVFVVTGPNTTHIYLQPGTYNVTLTVKDSQTWDSKKWDLTDKTWKLVTVYLPDVVALVNVTAYPTNVTKPEPVFINITVANEGVSNETFKTFNFTIYYNGNHIGTWTNITLDPGKNTTLLFTWNTTYIYATPTGTTYTISANATEHPYELNTINNRFIDGTVTVYTLLSAKFTYSPEKPIEGQPVNFNASLSTPNPKTNATITSYAWDFGDGTSGSGMTATHTYAKAGSYTVKLKVTDSEGLSDAVAATVIVYRRDVAIISVTPDETEVIIGEPVSINVTARNEGDFFTETFNVTVYYDGNPIETHTDITLEPGKDTTLKFTWETANVSPGAYTIKANATVVEGETEIDDNEMFFDGTITLLSPPVASFTWSPLEPVAGKEVTFNSTSTDPDGVITSWEWDFNGDGAIDATTESSTWTYDTAGTYNVTLTVTDDDGLTGTITKSITINETPTPGIPLYVIAAVGAVIIIASCIVTYYLIRKKP